MKLKADFLKALAHPTRLRIIEYLKKDESSVGTIGSALLIEQSVLSKHLLLLKQAGILTSRQQKTTVYYRVKGEEIFEILNSVSNILRDRLVLTRRMLGELGTAKLEKGAGRGK